MRVQRRGWVRRGPALGPTRRQVLAAGAGVLLACAGAGCYSFRPPFDKSVRTVYVPLLKSQTFRRDLNLQLTDLLIKEIEKRTPYKVVGKESQADTILDGTVFFEQKNINTENPYNLPRQLSASVNVRVKWTRNPPTPEEEARLPVTVSELVYFEPEIGETAMTAFYMVSQRIATQIVDMMEEPWEGGDPTAIPLVPESEIPDP